MNDTKYNSLSEADTIYVMGAFDNAFIICNYPNATKTVDFEEEGIINGFDVLEDDSVICKVRLMTHNTIFYLCVNTAYYMHTMRLKDINAEMLAYAIRNVTKQVDDFNDSLAFFAAFFKRNESLSNTTFFDAVLSYAIDDHIEPTYVYADYVDENKLERKIFDA